MTDKITSAKRLPDESALEAMAVCMGVVGRLFWEEPQDGIVDYLASMADDLGGEPFGSVAPEAAADLADALRSYGSDPEAAMAGLRQDRAFLFYQVAYSRTSPYESVYRTEDRTLFGPTTVQVAREYARYGLGFERDGKEPCDHFGLECSFVSRLASAAIEAIGDGDDEAVAGAWEGIGTFLSAHVLVYSTIYLDNFEAQSSTPLYAAAARLARDVLAWAADVTGAQAVCSLDPAGFPLTVRRAGKEY